MMLSARKVMGEIMAATVRCLPQVRRKLREIPRRPVASRPDLLAFLLFDERQSHQVVQEFAREEFGWLDSLAVAERMILFFFLPGHPQIPDQPDASQPAQVLVAEGGEQVRNPSLEVAGRFGLKARDLPGIVFFTELDLDRPGPQAGVFCPLRVALFKDRANAEDKLAHLFDLVHAAKRDAKTPEQLLASIRSRVQFERRKDMAAPLVAALRSGVISLVTFPGRLAEVAALAFGQEAGKRAVSGVVGP
jgi:hypothetical protein